MKKARADEHRSPACAVEDATRARHVLQREQLLLLEGGEALHHLRREPSHLNAQQRRTTHHRRGRGSAHAGKA